MMKRKKHTLWLELGGAVLWCLVTLFTDKLFFWYDWHSWRFFAYKALFILAAFGVIHGVVTLVQKVREKDSFTLRWLHCRIWRSHCCFCWCCGRASGATTIKRFWITRARWSRLRGITF